MNIIISNSSQSPIYEQIYTQIKGMILAGTLAPGDALPSMRLLAKELHISVITTKRAYEELERDGFIASVTGKGSFVSAKNTQWIKEEHLKEIEAHLAAAIRIARTVGLTADQLHALIDLYKGDE